MNTRQAGLTLVEVVAVSAIIAALVALLLPMYNSARQSARRSECISFLHQIHIATELYRSANDGSARYGDAYYMGLPPFPQTRAIEELKELRCTVAAGRRDRVLGTGYFVYFVGPDLDAQKPLWKDYVADYRDEAMLYADPFHNPNDIALDFGNHVTRFVIGVNLGGSVKKKSGKGDWTDRPWFNRQPE